MKTYVICYLSVKGHGHYICTAENVIDAIELFESKAYKGIITSIYVE